jgi:N-acetylmuramoyl-L-alanine amidase
MIAPVCAALALALAVPAGRPARVPARTPHAARRDTASRQSALDRARAMLAQVKRDPGRRRYRHHWERAIDALERAARGRDRAQGLLEASRARYALYRFSQVDADRDAALRLALRAHRAGARDAVRFAAAIRKEMGEEEPRKVTSRAAAPATGRTASATPNSRRTGARVQSEPEPAPELEAGAGAGAGSRAQSKARSEAATEAQSETDAETDAETEGERDSEAEAEVRVPAGQGPVATRAPNPAAVPPRTAAAAPVALPGTEDGKAPAAASEAPAPSEAEAGDGAGAVDEEALEQALAERPSVRSASGEAEDGERARVSEVRSWSNKEYTRVAIYLSRRVEVQSQEIPPDGAHPRRVALDLKSATLERGLAHSVGDSLVARVRAAQHDEDTVRVVLELPGKDPITTFRIDDPPRLIVDVGVHGPVQEAQAPTARAPEGEARAAVRRIIVDAGHGGHDSGAVGPTRVKEKDVTLAIARRLARRLRARGFEVLLTRDDDRYLALEERTGIANARHGDLFISVHANAHPRRNQRGVETYFLNVTDDRYARRLAARENGALSDEGGE